ncbi:MAG: hypothetical protein ACXADB_05350 [Candidatus Hermodarchaeia archaeon]|jgi:hypothetical protein
MPEPVHTPALTECPKCESADITFVETDESNRDNYTCNNTECPVGSILVVKVPEE